MTDPVQKRVFTVSADPTKALAVFEHDLGPDVLVQVRTDSGRIVKAKIDVTRTSVIVHFTSGIFEPLRVVVIG